MQKGGDYLGGERNEPRGPAFAEGARADLRGPAVVLAEGVAADVLRVPWPLPLPLRLHDKSRDRSRRLPGPVAWPKFFPRLLWKGMFFQPHPWSCLIRQGGKIIQRRSPLVNEHLSMSSASLIDKCS